MENYMEAVILSFVVIAALIPLVVTEYRRRKNNRSPEIRTYATVVSKRFDCANIAFGVTRDGGNVYYATFITGDGSTVELEMGRSSYGGLTAGAKGNLTYQGNQFLKFEEVS